MDALPSEAFSTKHIGHLGLVADKIDDLDLVQLIDQRIPVSKAHGANVSHGERVAAMILNGLGFIDSRLYLFPDFLQDKAVDKLFNKDIKADYFNDDALGRCLDEISAYGSTKLFTELSFLIGQKRGLLGDSVNIDTTTLSLYGAYDQNDLPLEDTENKEQSTPAQGHAKSGRHDLKQMVLLLATTGAASFPVWMEAHSGNASDQKTMPEAAVKIRALCAELKNSPDFMYVGDSAIYANILQHSEDMKWITRVPERIKEAHELVSTPKDSLTWHTLENGYSYCNSSSNYKDVEQRWVMFFSEAAYNRECKTLDKNIKKELSEQTKAWWHLSNRVFECEADCLSEIEKLKKKLKYHTVTARVEEIKKHTRPGRPRPGETAKIVGYQVSFELLKNEETCEKAREKKGRFILATNQLDDSKLSSAAVLKEYKAQSGTERGFKFIKDDTFQVDSVFLKKPHRIEALMMVMTLCLMVYGVSEYELRQSLLEANQTVPSQTKKEIQNPSMKWIYFLFRSINELHISVGDHNKKIVINMSHLLKRIVSHFGKRAQAIYLNST